MEPRRCHHTRFSEFVDDAQPRRKQAQRATEVIVIEDNDNDRQSAFGSSDTISHDRHALGPYTSRSSKIASLSLKYCHVSLLTIKSVPLQRSTEEYVDPSVTRLPDSEEIYVSCDQRIAGSNNSSTSKRLVRV